MALCCRRGIDAQPPSSESKKATGGGDRRRKGEKKEGRHPWRASRVVELLSHFIPIRHLNMVVTISI